MTITMSFPGGAAVDATFDGHTIRTDQPAPLGADTAGSPFDLFLASIGTCMGFYALRFCQERGLSTEGLALTLDPERTPDRKRVATIHIGLRLPRGFPEKYELAIQRAVDHCAVKRVLLEPPAFDLSMTRGEAAPGLPPTSGLHEAPLLSAPP
jgi:ribosomal protein S12 methylthiotransferase accessory factor